MLRFVRVYEEFPLLPGKFCIHTIKCRSTYSFRGFREKLPWIPVRTYACVYTLVLSIRDMDITHSTIRLSVVCIGDDFWLQISQLWEIKQRDIYWEEKKRSGELGQGTRFTAQWEEQGSSSKGWRCEKGSMACHSSESGLAGGTVLLL